MKSILNFLVLIIIFFLFACNNQVSKNKLVKANLKTIKINGDINNLLQIDSLFSEIKAIPLETRDDCLISRIVKIIIYNDKIFLQDKAKRLLVFNIQGKFLHQIGKKGNGPGEYLELRDFEIDKNGNIYVLEFKKILKYDNQGNYLNTIRFNNPSENCNPTQFVSLKNDFFLWNFGRFTMKAKGDKFYALYQMDSKGKIRNNFLEVKNNYSGNYNQFKKYKDFVLIDPLFGSNIIYTIDSIGIKERYYIDFGNRTLNIPIPEGFNSLLDFKKGIINSYYLSILGFTESKDWLYFTFSYRMNRYNAYYSKKLDKSFISKVYPRNLGRIAPSLISTVYNDDFIALCETQTLMDDILVCKTKNNISESEKRIINSLKLITSNDNPVLLICSMRKY